MKINSLKTIGIIALMHVYSCINSQTIQISDSLIKKSMQKFAKLVDSFNVQKFGAQNMAEFKSLKPGKQLQEFLIGLADIKKYKQGDDVNKIIIPFESVEVCLVNGSGKIITSIGFIKRNGRWEASSYGSSTQVLMLSQAQPSLSNQLIAKGDLIYIPALRTSFLRLTTGSVTKFVTLEDNTTLKFQKGQELLAGEAILSLKPLANKQKKEPR